MKNRLTLINLIMALVLVAGLFSSCEDSFELPGSPEGSTIKELAEGNSDLNILTAALIRTNLATSFGNINSGKFTVFAPTDDAFIAYFRARLSNANLTEADVITYVETEMNATTSTVTISALASVLTYHAVSSVLPSSEITSGSGFATVNGARISLSNTAAGVLINANGSSITAAGNGAKVVIADVEASNGIVHVIDKVLVPVSTASAMANTIGVTINYSTVPPSVSPTLTAAKSAADVNTADYDVFVYALVKSGLTSTLTPNKSPLPDFTFFTPNDLAFYAFLSEVTSTSITTDAGAIAALEAISAETIAEILKAHVVSGRILSSDLTDGQSVTPLAAGKNFTISIPGASVILKTTGPDATVTTANILTNAGVVHRINQVLKP